MVENTGVISQNKRWFSVAAIPEKVQVLLDKVMHISPFSFRGRDTFGECKFKTPHFPHEMARKLYCLGQSGVLEESGNTLIIVVTKRSEEPYLSGGASGYYGEVQQRK